MFILDTDHISLFQRRDPQVTARVLATSARELATTVITMEEQLRGRLDRVRRARSDAEVVRAYRSGSCWIPGSWDLPMSYNLIVVTISSLKPFFFNSLKKELCFSDHAWSIRPRNPIRALRKSITWSALPSFVHLKLSHTT